MAGAFIYTYGASICDKNQGNSEVSLGISSFIQVLLVPFCKKLSSVSTASRTIYRGKNVVYKEVEWNLIVQKKKKKNLTIC